MPNKHNSRATVKSSQMLVTSGDITSGNRNIFQHDRENIVPKMDDHARLEVQSLIRDRFDLASPETEDQKGKMKNWDLQYKGLFQDDEGDAEERIFLPKSREDINIVHGFIIDVISQLKPLVRIMPNVTSAHAADAEYRAAKVNEIMNEFYFHGVWGIIDNQFPRWLKHFLKYSSAIYKVSYLETEYNPDLILDVVDRALLYIDPMARAGREAQWNMERYWIPRTELQERLDRKDWIIPKNDIKFTQGTTVGELPDADLERFLGPNVTQSKNIWEDELVEVIDYWQYPRKGLGDLYAVMVGGLEGSLVRYGRNPYPYKGNQYVMSSYNPDDRPDGEGMCEQLAPFQKVINTWVNMRNDDVRSNVQRQVGIDPRMVDDQTLEDQANGQMMVRFAEEYMDALDAAGQKPTDRMVPFPSGTSTNELLAQDLPFILGQRQESSHLSDVFRGGNPPPGTPLGIVQEQLIKNMGTFKPVLRQVLKSFEDITEINTAYFKSEEFFPESRVITIVGKNSYSDIIPNWQTMGEDSHVMEVSADMMDVDVNFNAVSGADAYAARTLLVNTVQQLFQAIGQSPELLPIVKEDFNFAEFWNEILNTSGLDIDKLRYSDKEKQENAQKEQQKMQAQMQQQQQMIEMQAQMQKAMEEFKAQLDMAKEQNKQSLRAQSQKDIDVSRITQQGDVDIDKLMVQVKEELIADVKKILVEHTEIRKDMGLEAKLEKALGVQNVSPAGGQNIQQKKQ